MTVRLTEPQRRMLSLLPEAERAASPARPLARRMWPDNPHWQQYYNSGGHGANMPMIAGALLTRLLHRGLVCRVWWGFNAGWYISDAGKAALAEAADDDV